jgi:hypothetical protein
MLIVKTLQAGFCTPLFTDKHSFISALLPALQMFSFLSFPCGASRSIVSLDVQDLFAGLLVLPEVLFERQIASVPGSGLAASLDM